MKELDRRNFLRRSATIGGGLVAAGPLHAFGAKVALGQTSRSTGYGPLALKGDLWLPPGFNYQIISRQGDVMSDGNGTPGIFDGMGAYPGPRNSTILIRNHENRERPGEFEVIVPPELDYDSSTIGGNTKLVVARRRRGRNMDGSRRYEYRVVRDFAILGGTSTNCAGGVVGSSWVTCEEVVKGPLNGAAKKHGYVFEIPAYADGPVKAIPIPAAGRFSHEAVAWSDGILYETEDRSLAQGGACFYRYLSDEHGDDRDDDRDENGDGSTSNNGRLQALKVRDEERAVMDVGREVGRPYPVEWVAIDEPDHNDDTDMRKDRQPGFTPTRFQAQDRGAAIFDRQEGIWSEFFGDKVYFDCTAGGAENLGQVWEFDPHRETITLIYESQNPTTLENPDNVVIVPQTGDIFLQEDGDGEQFVRGLTRGGGIYDFAKTQTNDTEFCGGCFSPDGETFFLNQQGERGGTPEGPPGGNAVTYAIYGPFERDDDDDD